MNLVETLKKIEDLREKANTQQQEYQEGRRTEPPEVDPNSFDLMEKMTRNIYGDYSKGRASICACHCGSRDCWRNAM